jgi:excisionase family DNA binding protein
VVSQPKKNKSMPKPGQGEVIEFFTVTQVADLLQLNPMTIYRMVTRGELPFFRIGRLKRFRRREIEEFLEQCRISSTSEREAHRRKPFNHSD